MLLLISSKVNIEGYWLVKKSGTETALWHFWHCCGDWLTLISFCDSARVVAVCVHSFLAEIMKCKRSVKKVFCVRSISHLKLSASESKPGI